MDERRAALLVMDMQEFIVDNFVADGGLLDRVAAAVDAARAAGVPVIFVRVAFRDTYSEIPPTNKMFAAAVENGLLKDSDPASGVHPRLARDEREVIVTKRRVSPFAGTDLDEVLRAMGIGRVILAGFSTSGVVLSAWVDATDRDLDVTVLADACSDNSTSLHDALVGELFPHRADVLTIDAWAASL